MQPLCSFRQGRFLLSSSCREWRECRAQVGLQQRTCELAQGIWCVCASVTGEVVPKTLPRLGDGGSRRENQPCQAKWGDVLLVRILKASEQTILNNASTENLPHKSGGRLKTESPGRGPAQDKMKRPRAAGVFRWCQAPMLPTAACPHSHLTCHPI